MKLFVVLLSSLVLIAEISNADSRIYGVWENKEQNLRLDILDGFKAGQGPILQTNDDGTVEAGSWEEKAGQIEVSLGYSSYTIGLDSDSKIFLNPSYGDGVEFLRVKTRDSSQAVTLKENEAAFINNMITKEWLAPDGTLVKFKPTFSTDTGVTEYIQNDGSLENLEAWAISSGVLKIGSTVILEGRASDNYFIGLDEYDNFIVFRYSKIADPLISTNILEQREEFFNQLLSGDWNTVSWGELYIHKFRPVFGELKGVKLTTKENRLYDNRVWEYSPGTGAIKVGYSEYVGALVVNGTLAFIADDGDQEFFSRLSDDSQKRYTLGDVKEIALNEKSTEKIKKSLANQMQQGDYFFSFEFNQDNRTGFVHKWRSEPFTITGETFNNDLVGEAENLYQVEDFMIFGEDEVFKIDVSPSRLRPKTDEEVASSVALQKKLKSEALSQNLVVKVLKKDGSTIDVKLPIGDFSEVANISVVRE